MISKKQIIAIVLLFGLLSSVGFAQQSEGKSPAKRTAQFTEEGSEACMVCHSGEKMRAIAASPHANPDHPSAPRTTQGCEACHGPGSIHVSRAHGGQGFPKMITFGRGSEVSAREQQIDACLSCHSEELDSTQAIEFWGSAHDRKNINCSRCHLVHAETDPISEKEQQFTTCYRCHSKMKEEHPRFEDKSIDFDTLSCWDCHDVHKVNDEVN